MNIHEFQGKSLLSQFDIPVQPGIVLDLKSNLTSLKKAIFKNTKNCSKSIDTCWWARKG